MPDHLLLAADCTLSNPKSVGITRVQGCGSFLELAKIRGCDALNRNLSGFRVGELAR